METYNARLLQRIIRTPTIESFRFMPDKKIDFIPGQFLQVIFDEKNLDNKELNKYLSFSSGPAREYIEITKRLSESSFSQKLKNLKTGDEILLKAPFGACVFKDEYKKIAFLIGGIGITPVISILDYIVDKRLDTQAMLFYSNRREEEIAFRKELDDWRSNSVNLKTFYIITDYKPKDESCIFGRINKGLLQDEIKDLAECIFFIFGPPKMVEAMRDLCEDIDIRQASIKTESFIGY
jgi:ferredoxin-NADP reductase